MENKTQVANEEAFIERILRWAKKQKRQQEESDVGVIDV